jgi:cobalt/nickel transport system ATP-binding protein
MIEVNHVSFQYPNGKEALHNVNFTIKDGEAVGLVGCNGAGKSTLLSLLCGINFANEGEIKINDVIVKKDTLKKIRKEVGMVFQNPDEQLFMPNIGEDIAFGPRNYGLSEEEVNKRVHNALEKLEIGNLKDRPPYRLSGGEKRSAAIATVIAMEPSFILFDEPTAFLDPKATKTFQRIALELNIPFLIASHDLDVILNICDRVIILKNGEIMADGEPYDILCNEKLMYRAGLELPVSFSRCKQCPNADDAFFEKFKLKHLAD